MRQFIQNFFQWSEWFIRTKLPGCWQLKDKNSLSTIDNHLLEHSCNSNLSNTFIENCHFTIQIYCKMFRLHTVARERKSVRVFEQRHKETPSAPTDVKPQLLTASNRQLFQNSLISIYLNSAYQQFDVISLSYCVISHMSSISQCLYLLNQTCNKTWIYFVYIWSSYIELTGPIPWSGSTRTFQFDLHSYSKILANS